MKVTPAEIGEQLLKNEEPEGALRDLLEFLARKKRETERSIEEAASKSESGAPEAKDRKTDEL